MDNLHKEEEIMKRYRMDIEHLKLGRSHTFYSQQIVHKQFKHLNIQGSSWAMTVARSDLSSGKLGGIDNQMRS